MLKKSGVKRFSLVMSIFLAFSFMFAGFNYSSKKAYAADTTTLRFFSNLPDRSSGQGKLEQMLLDNYMAVNPNVKIEVESLQDEPYKQKFKAYASSNDLPDIFMVWGQPSFFAPIMKEGYAAELNKADYTKYGFFPGALDGFSMNGKLYGLPRNTDFMVLYYNKALFAKYKVKVPKTFEDLITAAKVFRSVGIAPCAINGKDKWTQALLFQDLIVKNGAGQKVIYDVLNGKTKAEGNAALLKAAKDFKRLTDAKFFQDAFVSADYGAANNLFAQEKAAMYYMGSWEVGMKSNPSFSASFKKNVAVINFPAANSKAKATDLIAWNGGGYAVSASSKQKAEAIKLLNYMMAPENWTKNAWQLGLAVPGQNYQKFMTGKENDLQKTLTSILSKATSLSGVGFNDSLTPNFKTDSENISQELSAGLLTPEGFLKQLDKAIGASK